MQATTVGIQSNYETYLTAFAGQDRKLANRQPSWLRQTRAAAMGRFTELGFPSTHVEEWKYTNIAAIAKTPFTPAAAISSSDASHALKHAFAGHGAHRLVFLNGRHCPEFSSLPGGVRLLSFKEAFETEAGLLEQHLTRYAGYENHAFVALNTAFLEDGVLLDIPKGAVIQQPVYLLFISSALDGVPSVTYPRTLILVGRNSQARVVETYCGLGSSPYFTNAVTEIVLGEDAHLEHTKIEVESDSAYHLGALHTKQERSSNLIANSISLGGSLVRNEAGAVLAGPGAECALNGLYLGTGRQHIDNYTTMDHAAPHCASHELYKGILDDKAEAVFHGRIIVRPDAQKTDAIQRNKNLLLSENAVVNTKPQLEIYADDVRCTHGATVGQVDAEAVFYLRSRGISLDEARSLLTYAFASEMIDRLQVESIRPELGATLFARLKRGPADSEKRRP